MSQPAAFKASLGLTNVQVTKIQAIHKNMVAKRTAHGAALLKLQQQLAVERQMDMPREAKVMSLMRKGRALRGKMTEEHAKARLRILKVLTQEQRTKYRAECPNGGKGAVGTTCRSGRRGGCGGGMHHGGRGMGRGR
jgi:DNA-binding MarR family transcriptional regulator